VGTVPERRRVHAEAGERVAVMLGGVAALSGCAMDAGIPIPDRLYGNQPLSRGEETTRRSMRMPLRAACRFTISLVWVSVLLRGRRGDIRVWPGGAVQRVGWQRRSVDLTVGSDCGRMRGVGPWPAARLPSGPCGGPRVCRGVPAGSAADVSSSPVHSTTCPSSGIGRRRRCFAVRVVRLGTRRAVVFLVR
jgi:hypothetical protein